MEKGITELEKELSEVSLEMAKYAKSSDPHNMPQAYYDVKKKYEHLNSLLNKFKNFRALTKEMGALGFSLNGNEFHARNRSVAHDDDCSDDERNDSFYDAYSDRFSEWANPLIKSVNELAEKWKFTLRIETSSEYGLIYAYIEDPDLSL